jgi:hypothetical protein
MTPSTPLTLDQASAAVTAAEATYNADTQSVNNIETSIATATAPLAAAQAQVQTDTANYVTALQDLIAAANAQISILQPTTTVAPSAPAGGSPVTSQAPVAS